MGIKYAYSLTPMQEGMLYQKMCAPDDTSYHVQNAFWIDGILNEKSIKESAALLSVKFDVLNSAIAFLPETSEAYQVILDNRTIEVIIENKHGEDESVAEKINDQDIRRGFDLEKDCLFRIKLVHFSEERHYLLFSFHHIIIDGWCNPIVFGDFFRFYTLLCEGVPFENVRQMVLSEKEQMGDYGEYIQWLEDQDQEESLHYWFDLLKDYDGISGIPHIVQQESCLSADAVSVYKSVDRKIYQKMQGISVQFDCTLSSILETVYGIAIQKLNRTHDVVFGKVVSGRNADVDNIESIVGLFINTVPLRIKIGEGQTFSQLITHVQAQNNQSTLHDYCSLKDIQRIAWNGRQQLESVFVYENYPMDPQELTSDSISVTMLHAREQTSYPLSVGAEVEDGELRLGAIFMPSKYSEADIERLLNLMGHILEQVADNPDLLISELSTVLTNERSLVLKDFNSYLSEYDGDETFVTAFEKQVEKTPDSIAVMHCGERLTYSELNKRANALASRLRRDGIKPEDFVLIMSERSLEMVVGVVGILKAGGAYVPVDSKIPEQRLKAIMEDCKPVSAVIYKTPEIEGIPCIDLSCEDLYNECVDNPEPVNSSADAAYVIYTSGTTGKPKGVVIEHHSCVNLREITACDLGFKKDDRVLLFANLTFDASAGEIIGSLLNGCAICIPQEEMVNDAEYISELIREEQLTVLPFPPQFAGYVSIEKARLFLTAGSEAKRTVVEDVVTKTTYINAYGPTETTVLSTLWKCEKGDEVPEKIPIGRPCVNNKIYIMNGNSLCGIGVPGEICIAGDGVARGYLNCEEQTAEHFINNPYGSGRMYRTGDLGRWMPDGNIEYLGRLDEQVKIRGYRIELTEIENAIREITEIKDCAVVARADKNGDKELYAYYVSDTELHSNAITERLLHKLPYYMCPTYISRIEEIPVTANGKVDVKALPEIEVKLTENYVAPQTTEEKLVCTAYEEVLGVERIGINDNFFRLGGDSIKVLQLNKSLKELGYFVSVRDILEKDLHL